MKKTSLIILFITFSNLFAQKLLDVIPFTPSYSLEKQGYPSKIIAGDKGDNVFVEYWKQGEAGRKQAGFYIESIKVDQKGEFDELWFYPIHPANIPYQFVDVFRLKKSFAVFGKLPEKKEFKTVVQFFGTNGKEISTQINASIYDIYSAKQADFEESFTVASDSSNVMWFAKSSDSKKKRHLASVFGADGKKIWSTELTIPYSDKKYVVKQSAIDNKGHAYFLMVNEIYTNTLEKDTLNAPVLLKYDYKQKKYIEFPIKFEKSAIPEVNFSISKTGNLIIMGVIADGSTTGLKNGGKIYPTALTWNKFFYKRFNIWEDMKIDQEQIIDVPEAFVKSYSDGANFSESRFLEKDNKLFWMFEEVYKQKKDGANQFLRYDIGVLAIDQNTSKILFTSFIPKKQRDFNNDVLFGYIPVMVDNKIHCVYMSEKGAQGKIQCSSIDMETGEIMTIDLIKNDLSNNYFFPAKSSLVEDRMLSLMGAGIPNKNQYTIMRVKFFEQKK